MSISEQVEELERLRAAGRLADDWYHRAKAQLVRRYRAERASTRATRATLEIRLGDECVA